MLVVQAQPVGHHGPVPGQQLVVDRHRSSRRAREGVGTSLTAGPPAVTARSGSPGPGGRAPTLPPRIFRLATQHRGPSATLWVVVRPAEVPPGFAAWYEAHHPRLVTVLRAVTTDADAAADAADEAMARCLLHWERVRHMASPAGWTYRVALNELRRVGRRRALEQRLL
ncbi:hypothetical protein GHK86_14350, partial [Acidimicrobiaceae bacterium USS-CC1]|nr:hypothetical protein [Acidiferrimicrobium australe]